MGQADPDPLADFFRCIVIEVAAAAPRPHQRRVSGDELAPGRMIPPIGKPQQEDRIRRARVGRHRSVSLGDGSMAPESAKPVR